MGKFAGKLKGALRGAINATNDVVEGTVEYVGNLAYPVDNWLKSHDLESGDRAIAYDMGVIGTIVLATLSIDRLARLIGRRR